MKTRDLMQGDKVYETLLEEKPQPVTVMEVGQNHIYVLLDEDDETLLRYEPEHIGWRIKDIEPIPLTEEILKANGFENYIDDYGNPSLRLKGTDDANDANGLCYIDWTPKGKGFQGKLFDGFLYILMNIGSIHLPCKFAHELQHALRLCGLNDLADKFIVPCGDVMEQ